MSTVFLLEREHELKDNLDQFGLVCKRNSRNFLDGGDTLANEATILFCKAIIDGPHDLLRIEYEYTMRMLNPSPGVWVRHPDSSMWYSKPDRISRDQMVPVVCAWIAFSDYLRAKEFSSKHGLFFKGSGYLNGQDKIDKKMPWYARDITTPIFEGLLSRALNEQGKDRQTTFKMKFADWVMYLSAKMRLHRKNGDLRNFILPLLASHISFPTKYGDKARRCVDKDYLKKCATYWWNRTGEPKKISEYVTKAIDKIL